MSRPDRIVVSLGNGGSGGSWPGNSSPIVPPAPPGPVTLLALDFSGQSTGLFTSFPAGLSLLRSSDAGFETATGFVSTVGGNDKARIASLGAGAVLRIEATSTNICDNSSTITSGAGWTLGSVTTQGQTGPDGGSNAVRFNYATSQQVFRTTTANILPTPARYTWSFWAKQSTLTTVQSQLSQAGVPQYHQFTLSASWAHYQFTYASFTTTATGIVAPCVTFDGSAHGGVTPTAVDLFYEYPQLEQGLHSSTWTPTTRSGEVLQDTVSAPQIDGKCSVLVPWRPDISQSTAVSDGRTRMRIVGTADDSSWIDVDVARQYMVACVDGVRSVMGSIGVLPSWSATIDTLAIDTEGWGGGAPSATVVTNGGGASVLGSGPTLPRLRTESDTVFNWFADSSRTKQLQGGIVSMRIEAISGAPSAPSNKIYASPTGTGSGTKVSPASLLGAIALARSLRPATVQIVLRGGTYYLTSTLALTDADNNLEIVNYPGEVPILSGGVVVTGWTDDGTARGVQVAACSVATRQLWVNGARAIRARSAMIGSGVWTATSTGFTANNTTIAGFARPLDVQLVGRNQWRFLVVGLSAVSGTTLTARAGDLHNANSHPFGLDANGSLLWYEWADELLTTPTYFYRSAGNNTIKYATNGENMGTALAVVGSQQTLMTITGTSTSPARITIRGVTFAETTWTAPDTTGYADLQSGLNGDSGSSPTGSPPPSPADILNYNVTLAPSAVVLRYATSTFTGCTFTRTGACGLHLQVGSQGSQIIGCTFSDIALNAINLGDASTLADRQPAQFADRIDSNTIRDCTFTNVGQDYPGAAAIFGGYVSSNAIDHSVFQGSRSVYTAIGFGFALLNASPANVLGGNSVTRCQMLASSKLPLRGTTNIWMADFGECYWLGLQNGGLIQGNDISPDARGNGAVYLDGGCDHVTVDGNVMRAGSSWVFFQGSNPSAVNNLVTNNFWAGNAAGGTGGTGNTLSGNVNDTTLTTPGAQAIILAAGLQ